MTDDLMELGEKVSEELNDELGLTNGEGTDNPSVCRVDPYRRDFVRVYPSRGPGDDFSKESAEELAADVDDVVEKYGLSASIWRTNGALRDVDTGTDYHVQVDIKSGDTTGVSGDE